MGLDSAIANEIAVLTNTPEIIKRENGILVDPGDIGELSNAILRLVRKEDLERIGKKNRETASNTFTFERVVRDNISNYEELFNY